MAEQSFSYLDQLTPAEVFELLIKASDTQKGAFLENIHILLPETMPFQFVSLELPDPFADKETVSEEYKEIFKTLVSDFKTMTGRGELYHSPGGESKPLLEGMAWLLTKSAPSAGEEPAEGQGHQYMVITGTIDEERAEELFKNLSFHATTTRVTSVNTMLGTGTRTNRYLFHLVDDPGRKSSFRGAAASGVLQDCALLKGFDSEGTMTFLPPESTPGEQMLKYFCRLVERAPRLFSSREREETNLTAAVVQWLRDKNNDEAGDDVLEFIYMGGLRFFGEELFTARKVKHATFEYLDLETSRDNLDKLAERVQEAEPFVGYRLELRTTDHIDKNTIERLNQQKARIDYHLAYLQSVSKPRPLLLRFTQQQLPALAAEIRSFPIHAILEGSIKYGFQATQREPAGFHFLFIDPAETARLELDPYPLWRDLGAEHMRFRLDPYWAGHYFDGWGIGEAMVFVREGSTIYPPLHSWEPRSMDTYLRETMTHWFQSELKQVTVPERPIYIFDGEPVPKAAISISLLDRDRMEPLHTRLGWLNDNLVIHRAIEKEGLISQMAKDISWQETAEKIKQDMEISRQEFEETSVAAAQYMANTTAEMTGILTSEINRVVRDTFRLAEKIKRTDERLLEWTEICSDMEEMLQEVRQQWQHTTKQKGEAHNEFWKIQQDIERELTFADGRRKEMQERLEEEIKKMQITNRQLRRRLRNIKL
jgi:hypothetical protein